MNFNLFSKFLVFILFLSSFFANSQKAKFTHADTLKGSIGKGRDWWDVTHYNIHVKFNIPDSSISGYNIISYKVLKPYQTMQIDLMTPMLIDSVLQEGNSLKWTRDGNAFFITLQNEQKAGSSKQIKIVYHGKPRAAAKPPWDGGVIWQKDKKGNPWISIACQGMAAQVWFPNKDHMYDEVDSSSLFVTAPRELITVSNGNLRNMQIADNANFTYNWVVLNPINNYNIIPYIGRYSVVKDTFNGKGGLLTLSYWVLEGNSPKAREHFKQVKLMLRCFEDWFGKYPFYEDGYKLVEAPFLGMEHQSAIAYGNDFQQGYQGRDLSLTGWGLKWDFIIVHESGHEWFGNSITAKDVADNWVHEGFTAYSENLFNEYLFGKKAGAEYVIGTRVAVQNDKPIISAYNVNEGGSLDLYYKAANMLHNIRQIVNNDSLWKEMLRGMNKTFYHQTITTKQIEDYMIGFLKLDLQKTFDQYLRTIKIPVLEYKLKNGKLKYRWSNCVKGFNMPLRIYSLGKDVWLKPTEKWQTVEYGDTTLTVDPNFFVTVKAL